MASEATNPFLAAALGYATQYHWYVFPLKPGDKIPLTPNGFQDATTDIDQITQWWEYWPKANIGIATGASNLVVLDPDGPVGRAILDCYPPTLAPTVTTGKGQHLYFRREASVPSRQWSEFQLDVRGDTGYVVAPPSVHPNGAIYEWQTELMVPPILPVWVPTLLTALQVSHRSYQRYLGEARTGNRNEIGSYVVQQLLDNGLPENVVEVLANHYQQTVQDIQPDKDPYTPEEIAATFRGTLSKPRRAPAWSLASDDAIHLTDLGNARRFVRKYGDTVRYNVAWAKWMYWTGYNWATDEMHVVKRLMHNIPTELLREGLNAPSDEARAAYTKWGMKSQSHGSQEAALAEVAKMERIVVDPDSFDTDPWLLNTPTGLIDLRTRAVRAAQPDDLVHHVTRAVYDVTAKCPTWEALLETTFQGNKPLIQFFQRFMGYCLTGLTIEQKWAFAIGQGSNGKSTIFEGAAYPMGSYAMVAPATLFLEQQGSSIPNDIAKLPGRRFVYAKEPDKNKRLATGRIKELTGGDTISARFMRAEFFEFKPCAKLVLAANHRPGVRDQSHGFWRRLLVLPFDVQIEEEQSDKHLSFKLEAEASGILNWLLDGCTEWQRQGLNPPKEVTGATNEYRSESDLVGEWLSEYCELDKGSEASFAQLYASWSKFLEENGETEDKTRRAFAARLMDRGFTRRKALGGPVYKGLKLAESFHVTGEE